MRGQRRRIDNEQRCVRSSGKGCLVPCAMLMQQCRSCHKIEGGRDERERARERRREGWERERERETTREAPAEMSENNRPCA